MKFGFRVSLKPSSGLGHLARTARLAKKLKKLGIDSVFVLDSKPVAGFIDEFKSFVVVSLDENTDAIKCIDIFSSEGVDSVVLDSYELGLVWQKNIRVHKFRLCVIDDLLRKSECDYLINFNPKSNYSSLVNSDCKLLIGQDYALLDDDYANKITPPLTPSETVLFSLGGGGDLSNIKNAIIGTLELGICVYVIVGDFCINYEFLDDIKNDRLFVIKGANSLYKYYLKADLFVGALGTSLYELSALSLPSLTFSISDNQSNDYRLLELFGNHFHIDFDDVKRDSGAKMGELIALMLKNLAKIKALRDNAKLKVDGLGADRVASILSLNKYKEPKKLQTFKPTIYEKLANNLSIRAVNDGDVNLYLEARNLLQNTQNMQVKNRISRLNHYIWWLQNIRHSYVVNQDERPVLFIWHELFTLNSRQFLVGGWFVASDDTSFAVAALALQWQLRFTQREFANATWVAIIKKSNEFVYALNTKFGFTNVLDNSPEEEAIKKYFKNPDKGEFYYVKKHI